MIFYHGTSIIAVDNILRGIDSTINAKTELDYGQGFYGSLEKDFQYARKHAVKVTKDSLGRKNVLENAVIVKCEIDDKLFKNPKYITKRDDEFIEFVFQTRKNYLCENIPYDFIEGPMADGNVDSLMTFYKKHQKELAKRWVKFCYKLPFNLHTQIVIKSQELCDKIKIVEIKNLKGGIIYAENQKN